MRNRETWKKIQIEFEWSLNKAYTSSNSTDFKDNKNNKIIVGRELKQNFVQATPVQKSYEWASLGGFSKSFLIIIYYFQFLLLPGTYTFLYLEIWFLVF